MEENQYIESDEGLSLLDIIKIIKRHIVACFVSVILFVVIMMVYSFRFQTPVYTSTATAMVNTATSAGGSSASINNDYMYAQRIISTYEILIKSDKVLGKVSSAMINEENLEQYTTGAIRGMVSTRVLAGTSSVTESLIIAVTVTGYNPDHCAIIANYIVRFTGEESGPAGDFPILKNATFIPVDSAKPNPNYDKNLFRNGFIGCALGVIVAAVYILIREALDTTVSDIAVIENSYNLNILTIVPDIDKIEKLSKK